MKPSNMEFHLLPIFTFLTLVLAVTHVASSPPEVYWRSMLPAAPMPKSIKDILPTGGDMRKPAFAAVNTKGVVNIPNARYVGNYQQGYAVAKPQSHGEHQMPHIFFLEKDLRPGSELDFSFINGTSTAAKFWPRQLVKSIPFSQMRMPEILKKFSINPKSKEAEVIKSAIILCEEPAMNGEEKYCASSLESMVDFCISKLGKNVKVISTETEKKTKSQKYRVTTEAKLVGDKDVICHKENYPYALYYCHKLDATVVYSVGLKGIADGTKVKAVAICHRDTSKWSPMHLAFQELKVKPGTNSICHFLSEDNVVRVSN